MPGSIPLIRASAIAPFLRWMRANGRPVDTLLRGSGLAEFPVDDPDQPIPLLGLFRFARMAGEVEGPDLPSRVVTPDSLSDMGYIGSVALAGKTVLAAPDSRYDRDAGPHDPRNDHGQTGLRLSRSCARPGECVWTTRRDITPSSMWPHWCRRSAIRTMPADPCSRTWGSFPIRFTGSRIFAPISELGCRSPGPVLELHIPDHMVTRHIGSADRVLPAVRPLPDIALPSGNDAFISSARIIVAGLLAGTTPTVDQIALAAGQSVRNFQRRLTTKGTTFFATGRGCPPRTRHRRTGRRPHIGRRHCRVARLPASIIADAGGAPMVGQHATQRASPHGPA